jgi:hypothetical protein
MAGPEVAEVWEEALIPVTKEVCCISGAVGMKAPLPPLRMP